MYISDKLPDAISGIVSVPATAETGGLRWSRTTARSVAEQLTAARHASYSQEGHYWSGYCCEHSATELVPAISAHEGGLWVWYSKAVARHPRFSVYLALERLGFRLGERWTFLRSPDCHIALREAADCPGNVGPESRFCTLIADLVPVFLYINHQRVRVTTAFANKYRSRSFTVADWKAEPNHTLRNLMFRRGVEPNDLSDAFKVESQSAAGEYLSNSTGYYLRVTCPSTGQVYILETVMPQLLAQTYPGLTIDVPPDGPPPNYPLAAKLYSFGLPSTATFANET